MLFLIFRRKYYTLYWQTDENRCPTHQQTNLDIVTHVYICSAQSMSNCVNYFPNVIELSITVSMNLMI
jgi:hypothetical protein